MIDSLFYHKASIFEKACIYHGRDIREDYKNARPEEKEAKKKELQIYFALNAMELLEELEYQPLPSYTFDLTDFVVVTTPRIQAHDQIQEGKDIFYDKMKMICEFNKKMHEENLGKPYLYIQEFKRILSKAATLASYLQYFGMACYALAWLLEEGTVEIVERYVKKVIRAENIETDMKILKLAIEDLKAKLLSIQNILYEVSSQRIDNGNHREMLVISLLQPCEEIYQKFHMRDGIFRQFSSYSIKLMAVFFKLHLSLLSILKTQFEVSLDGKIKEKMEEYPRLLEEYINEYATNRIKGFTTGVYSCEYCAKKKASKGSWVGKALGALFLTLGAPIPIPLVFMFGVLKSHAIVSSQDYFLRDDKTNAVVVRFCNEKDDGLFDYNFQEALLGEDSLFKLYFKEKFKPELTQLNECISSLKKDLNVL